MEAMAHRNFIDLSMMVICCSLQTVSLPEGKMVGVWMILGDFDVDFPLQCGDFDERLNGDIDRIVWELIGLCGKRMGDFEGDLYHLNYQTWVCVP